MLRAVISEREKELPVSVMAKLIRIAEESKDIISLGPGEPDFDSPKHIIKAAKGFLDKGFTHYSPPKGREDLREEFAKKLKKENKIKAGPDDIIVTTGSTEGIILGLMCLIDPGEGVLLTDPGFLAYKPSVEVLNGMPISVPLLEKDKFQPDADVMEDLIIPEKTKAIILNTPCNPTGTVYTRKTLESIADFAVEYDLVVISDEAYEKLLYDNARHISMASLNGMEDRTLSLFSFSKTYAMPGFRLGMAVGPENLINAMTKLHVYTSLCAPTISQVTGLASLKGPQKCISDMSKEYSKRRQYLSKKLCSMGIPFVKPMGAFYFFPNISNYRMKSLKFSEWLLEKAKVSVVPGTEFGRNGEGFIRISYATALAKIKKAMDKMETSLGKL